MLFRSKTRFGTPTPLATAEQIGKDFFEFLGVKTLEEARALDAFEIRDKYSDFAKDHYDFNTGKTLPTPPGGQYVYAGKIPAIVSEELWIAANRAADERLCRKKVGKSVQT